MKQKRYLYLVLLIALVARLAFSLIIHPIQNYLFSDMQSYLNIAQRIISGSKQLGNIFYPPGYSLFLSTIIQAGGEFFFLITAVLQSLIGVISIWLFYQISTQVLKPKLSTLFLLILALYYPFIDTTGYLLSENLAIFFLALTLWLSLKFSKTKANLWLFLAGLSVGIGSLVRANLLIIGLVILVWITITLKSKLRSLSVFITATMASLLLVSGIYFKLGGQSRTSSLNGGFVFMAGQCLVGHSYDSTGAAFGPPVYMQRDINKTVQFTQAFTNSRYFYQQGLECLKQRPVRLLEKITENYYLFFDNISWPSSNQTPFNLAMELSHTAFNLFVLPGLLLAAFLFSRQIKGRRVFTSLLWYVLFTVFLTSTVYHADIRYRLPFDAIFILVSLSGYQLLGKLKGYIQPGIKR